MYSIRDVDQLQVLETLPIIAFLKDNQGKYIWVNQTFLNASGFASIDEVKGKDDFALIDKQQAERVAETDKKILSSGEAVNLEERFTVQGKEIHAHTVKFPTQINGQTHLLGFMIQKT